ncbi:MAG TPA: hypothetical protein PLE74_11355 [Candidatus Cloacimonadota bacterium]|nr:hypothetical protein [Candidatus Cloacimonadota bacterium]
MARFTVHVEHGNGHAASGSKVFLDIHKWPASTWLEGNTDSNGDMDFDVDGSGIEICFHVNGRPYQTETVHNGDCVYITI